MSHVCRRGTHIIGVKSFQVNEKSNFFYPHRPSSMGTSLSTGITESRALSFELLTGLYALSSCCLSYYPATGKRASLDHSLILHLNCRVEHRPLIQLHPQGSCATAPKDMPHIWNGRIPIIIQTLGDIKCRESMINCQNVRCDTKRLQGQILEYIDGRMVGHGR